MTRKIPSTACGETSRLRGKRRTMEKIMCLHCKLYSAFPNGRCEYCGFERPSQAALSNEQGSARSSPSVVWEEYDDDAYDGDCLSFDAEGEEDCGTDMGYADDEDYAE